MAELFIPVDSRFKSDQIMQEINRKFISLDAEETRVYNVHLKRVLDHFIDEMKAQDPMFSACYQRLAYVGSFYEGLKVGRPEEFDLNVIIKLPIDYQCLTVEVAREKSGYVKIKADADVLTNLKGSLKWKEYKVMNSWFAENSYLNQNKFRDWFESVFNKAYNSVNNRGIRPESSISVKFMDYPYILNHKKSGPALTLKFYVPGGYTVDVDLVPVLEFTTPPPKPFMNRNTEKQNWFTISKPLEGPNNHILWRPSFYEKEREILEGRSKPAIRLMKKLRDTQLWPDIASYFIKTLVLWEFEERKLELENCSLTSVFYHMLTKLQEACENYEILDFWNPENNLLSKINRQRMKDISCRLIRIIRTINGQIATDPYAIARFILSKAELDQLTIHPDPSISVSKVTAEMDSMYLTPSGRPAEVVVPKSEQNIEYSKVAIAVGIGLGALAIFSAFREKRPQ